MVVNRNVMQMLLALMTMLVAHRVLVRAIGFMPRMTGVRMLGLVLFWSFGTIRHARDGTGADSRDCLVHEYSWGEMIWRTYSCTSRESIEVAYFPH